MRPTPEQERAVALFLTGASLKINAFAGAGKTSTLLLAAAATEKRGVYLAFNRSIAEEARAKFPSRVTAHTVHGLAFRAMRARYRNDLDKLTGSANALLLAERLALQPMRVSRTCYLTPRMVAAVLKATVQRFTQSDAPAPTPMHVPRWGSTARLPWWRFHGYARRMAAQAARLWERMIDPRDDVPLGHDGYLKLWALGGPRIDADFLLLDEAQDSSGVVVGLLARQAAQVIYVGDRHQQIYAWRGAVNAMDRVRTRHRTNLTQSFRFGPAIAALASRVLRVLGERTPIRGNDGIDSMLRCPHPDAILCRSNAEVLARAMHALEAGRRPAVVGGGRDLLALLDDVERLQDGKRALGATFFGYRRWSEVLAAAEAGEADDLAGLVRLTQRHEAPELRRCLGALVPEDRADLVVSTAHKAKGMEWDRVLLADDFRPFRERRDGTEEMRREDVRLLYVAVTRARREVEMPRLLRRRFLVARSS